MIVISGLRRQALEDSIERFATRHGQEIANFTVSITSGNTPEFFDGVDALMSVLGMSDADYTIGLEMRMKELSFFVSFIKDQISMGASLFDSSGTAISRSTGAPFSGEVVHPFFDQTVKESSLDNGAFVEVGAGEDEENAMRIFSGTWAAFKERSVWRECLDSEKL